MQAPDPVEAALRRLMPPALSDGSQRDIEAMLDELAGEDGGSEERSKLRTIRWLVPAGIAAAVAAMFTLLPQSERPGELVVSAEPFVEKPSDLVLVSETDRIEEMTDEGWMDDPDGMAMHAVRLRVVEENTLRDEETGFLVQVSQPREEVVLTPVSAF